MAHIITIKFRPKKIVLQNHGLEEGGKVHAFFTETCARYMDKYVPYDEGTLASTVEVGKKTITYTQPYAEYQYRGERNDGSREINEENRNRSMHPHATSYWDYVMMSVDGDDVLNEVQEFYNREGGK